MKYDELDDLILLNLAFRPHTFAQLEIALSSELEEIKEETGRPKFRILDGRLQALRKAGRITFGRVSLRWKIGGA